MVTQNKTAGRARANSMAKPHRQIRASSSRKLELPGERTIAGKGLHLEGPGRVTSDRIGTDRSLDSAQASALIEFFLLSRGENS